MVIDASLNASEGTLLVEAAFTAGFYDTDTMNMVSGAAVRLTDGTGKSWTLTEVSTGFYSTGGLLPIPGETFRLDFTARDGAAYSAEATVPYAVKMDTLKVVRGFGDPRPTSPPVYVINPMWKDPVGTPNFYRFKVVRNGKIGRSSSFNITNDEPFDGTEVDMPLYMYGFSMGDTVRFEFQSIDSASYAYFNQINDMARPSFVSATPYNPIGNFSNGALGYFGIYHTEIRDLIIMPGK
jgi:hypothetical protein